MNLKIADHWLRIGPGALNFIVIALASGFEASVAAEGWTNLNQQGFDPNGHMMSLEKNDEYPVVAGLASMQGNDIAGPDSQLIVSTFGGSKGQWYVGVVTKQSSGSPEEPTFAETGGDGNAALEASVLFGVALDRRLSVFSHRSTDDDESQLTIDFGTEQSEISWGHILLDFPRDYLRTITKSSASGEAAITAVFGNVVYTWDDPADWGIVGLKLGELQ